jgi:hypothetical protein
MAWQGNRCLVIRGNTTNDPEAGGSTDAWVGVTHALPSKGKVGDAMTYVGDVVRATRARRWMVEVETLGYATEGQIATGDTMDYGMYLRLEDVLAMPYVWIYRSYNIGTSTATGPIRRAASHAHTVDGADTFWNAKSSTSDSYPFSPVGVLPLPVECLDDLTPQLASGGISELSFTLTGR